MIVNFKILYATSTHTFYSFPLVFLSVLSYVLSYLYISTIVKSPIFNTFEINMENYNSYFIVLILMIICLLLDYGINKLLIIFGYIINAKKIDIQKYELLEHSKNDIDRSSLKNTFDSNTLFNENSAEANSKINSNLFSNAKKFNNLCKKNFCLLIISLLIILFFNRK